MIVGNRQWSKVVEIGGSDVEVALTPGIFARVAGQIRSEGVPLPAGLRVSLLPRDPPLPGQSPVAAEPPAIVNGGGAFVFDGVAVGSYDLKVSGGGQPFFISTFFVNGRDAPDADVVVGDDERSVTISGTLDFQPASISGKIVDDDGKTQAGLGVVAWNADSDKRLSERYFRSTFTDSFGHYRLTGLVPGDYFVAIWADYDPDQALEPEVLRRLEEYAVSVRASRQDNSVKDLRLTQEVRSIPGSFVR
jgi:hypothetical protein